MTNQDDQSENPYASPQSEVSFPSVVPESDEERELQHFVGPRAGYYLTRWRSALRGGDRRAGFNWAAFFFTGLWLAYRKMYTAFLVFFGIIIVETILEELLYIGVMQEEAPAVMSIVVGLAAAVICGAYGNQWYLSHAKKQIAQARAKGYHDEGLLLILARRGGTHWWAAWLVLALWTLLNMLASWLLHAPGWEFIM